MMRVHRNGEPEYQGTATKDTTDLCGALVYWDNGSITHTSWRAMRRVASWERRPNE